MEWKAARAGPPRWWASPSKDCSSAASWDEEVAVTDAPFDSRRAPVARGCFLGDYVGLGQDGTAFFPFFAVTTATDPANIVTREVGQ
jgi:hypothetical protein